MSCCLSTHVVALSTNAVALNADNVAMQQADLSIACARAMTTQSLPRAQTAHDLPIKP